jgi:hypothetical protein
VTRNCDGLKVTSARRSIVSGPSRGSGWPLWARIALVALRSRGPSRADVPLITLRSRRTDRADLAPIASWPWRPLRTGLAPIPSGPRQSLGARSARWSSWTSWPRLALQIGQLLGQPPHPGFERIQTLRRRRLAGSAWFGGTHPLGLACQCSSFGRSLAWASCHSTLLHEMGRGVGSLRLARHLRASETPRPSRDYHSHRAVGFVRHDLCDRHRRPSD